MVVSYLEQAEDNVTFPPPGRTSRDVQGYMGVAGACERWSGGLAREGWSDMVEWFGCMGAHPERAKPMSSLERAEIFISWLTTNLEDSKGYFYQRRALFCCFSIAMKETIQSTWRALPSS